MRVSIIFSTGAKIMASGPLVASLTELVAITLCIPGSLCDVRKLPCLPNPCKNGGKCTETAEGYACTCPEAFLGPHCDTELNSTCATHGCQPEPTCSDEEHPSMCVCEEGGPAGSGRQCRRVRQPCASSPCLNNGSCVSLGDDYTCSEACDSVSANASVADKGNRQRSYGTGVHNAGIMCGSDPITSLKLSQCPEEMCSWPTVEETFFFTPFFALAIPATTPHPHPLSKCLCAPGWTGEVCQHVENACLIYPEGCMNGATCVSVSQPTAPPRYTCKCAPGYTGRHCEAEVDECESSPCRHNGTCTDLVGSYRCTCPPGFSGMHCEVDVDVCAFPNATCPPKTVCLDLSDGFRYTCRKPCPQHIQPCANEGRCILNNATSYSCVCPAGWTGHNCLVNINDCNQHWCQNGGTCVDKHGTCLDQEQNYTCRCLPGYEGRFCEMRANQCRSSPCSNGATCIETAYGYQCLCAPGFEGFGGPFCEVNQNDCESMPCQNGAVCVDDVDAYRCFCPEGKNCSVAIPDCASPEEACPSKATCSPVQACLCHTELSCASRSTTPRRTSIISLILLLSGSGGEGCLELPASECVSSPCEPAGTRTCVEQVSGFKCVCRHGHTGRFCETPISHCVHGLCQHGSKCVDLHGGFTCQCLPGNHCEIEVNECLSQPCLNGGSCSDELNAFSCQCPYGVTGDLCEISVDECQSSPCQHNGTCVDLAFGYKCICLPGFTGSECELDIDECASSPCKNGATCIDQPGNYSCQCVAPFKGLNCEFLPCEASNPCENGAECVAAPDPERFPLGFRCLCQRGFAGPRCEINVDECRSNPCLHGFCYDDPPSPDLAGGILGMVASVLGSKRRGGCRVVDGFYCLCNPGYAGVRCEQDIDDCVSNMCANNATCVDLHMGYQCVCAPGWGGDYCQEEVDECVSQPCRNNATCIDLFNSYRCICARGWTGSDCGVDINECDSAPCLNGARCVQSEVPGEFSCTCTPFFTGPLCGTPFDPCDPQHDPCRHNSTCSPRPDGLASCHCLAGES
ncbi:hypothetical protein ACEWY4_020994 [Coilia grayii]|uniref:EGF-like domain-containing protein n=1 Tax=Coilia grayii TaxID=363190 RepID=A0ABD1J922_9TELE